MLKNDTLKNTKLKVLVIGPVLTRSGYGEHSRFVVDSLLSYPHKFDVFINPIKWAYTDWALQGHNKTTSYEYCINKYHNDKEKKYDVILAVTIPPEYGPYLFKNDNIDGVKGDCLIGVMAGMETDKANPSFNEPCEAMDLLIVPSEHAKSSLDNIEKIFQTAFTEEAFLTYGISTPIKVISYPVVPSRPENLEKLDLNIDTSFNFLSVAQLGPRKNVEKLVQYFCEEFKNDDVGLVLKANIANDNRKDFYNTQAGLRLLINNLAPFEKKCKVYLIHGNMSRDQMNSLYTHPDIHQFVSISFGEGFGLPVFEAAYNGVPVVTNGWSGPVDFLKIDGNEYYDRVPYDLKEIDKAMIEILPEMAVPGMKWAHARDKKFKKILRSAYTNHKYKKSRALKLQELLLEKLSKGSQYKSMCDTVYGAWKDNQDLRRWSENQNKPRSYK